MLNLDLEGDDFSDYGEEQQPANAEQEEYNPRSPNKLDTEPDQETDGYHSEFSNEFEPDVCLERAASEAEG